MKGFKWKEGARYIRIHKHLTGDLRKVSKFLPWRRKTGGVEPGITNEEVTKVDGDVEKQWVFPRCTPTVQEEKELIARCAEIATRTIFQNFSYKFAGKVYLQTDGGPIGARVTMCLARIVMHDWGEKYRAILTRASLRIALLSSYVDDVRQGTTCLRFGMRFDVVKLEFVWSMGAEEEDKNMRREIGESNNRRMSRICLPAINSINKDLEFTSEVPEDFEDGRLPTLDTNWWQLEDYTISHSYFEKAMRTPYVIMSKSAISDNSRYNILSNELVRRLSNMGLECTTQDEKNEVVEHYIQQCKTSGYSRHETREGVVSGIKGWKRKHERRKRDGISFYRGARSTLAGRVKKKLTEKTSWYKTKRKREDEEDDQQSTQSDRGERDRVGSPSKRRKRNQGEEETAAKTAQDKKALEAQMPGTKEDQSAIAVMFVPYTKGAELAKRVRRYENAEKETSGWFFKVVERAGDSLVDLIHRSDPWSGEDCMRDACKPCWTKMKLEKWKTQDCSKRNCIYENWCMTCWEDDTKEIEEKCGEDEKMKKEMMKNRRASKYIGETSRSVYERTWEHTNSMKQLQPSSHCLDTY